MVGIQGTETVQENGRPLEGLRLDPKPETGSSVHSPATSAGQTADTGTTLKTSFVVQLENGGTQNVFIKVEAAGLQDKSDSGSPNIRQKTDEVETGNSLNDPYFGKALGQSGIGHPDVGSHETNLEKMDFKEKLIMQCTAAMGRNKLHNETGATSLTPFPPKLIELRPKCDPPKLASRPKSNPPKKKPSKTLALKPKSDPLRVDELSNCDGKPLSWKSLPAPLKVFTIKEVLPKLPECEVASKQVSNCTHGFKSSIAVNIARPGNSIKGLQRILPKPTPPGAQTSSTVTPGRNSKARAKLKKLPQQDSLDSPQHSQASSSITGTGNSGSENSVQVPTDTNGLPQCILVKLSDYQQSSAVAVSNNSMMPVMPTSTNTFPPRFLLNLPGYSQPTSTVVHSNGSVPITLSNVNPMLQNAGAPIVAVNATMMPGGSTEQCQMVTYPSRDMSVAPHGSALRLTPPAPRHTPPAPQIARTDRNVSLLPQTATIPSPPSTKSIMPKLLQKPEASIDPDELKQQLKIAGYRLILPRASDAEDKVLLPRVYDAKSNYTVSKQNQNTKTTSFNKSSCEGARNIGTKTIANTPQSSPSEFTRIIVTPQTRSGGGLSQERKTISLANAVEIINTRTNQTINLEKSKPVEVQAQETGPANIGSLASESSTPSQQYQWHQPYTDSVPQSASRIEDSSIDRPVKLEPEDGGACSTQVGPNPSVSGLPAFMMKSEGFKISKIPPWLQKPSSAGGPKDSEFSGLSLKPTSQILPTGSSNKENTDIGGGDVKPVFFSASTSDSVPTGPSTKLRSYGDVITGMGRESIQHINVSNRTINLNKVESLQGPDRVTEETAQQNMQVFTKAETLNSPSLTPLTTSIEVTHSTVAHYFSTNTDPEIPTMKSTVAPPDKARIVSQSDKITKSGVIHGNLTGALGSFNNYAQHQAISENHEPAELRKNLASTANPKFNKKQKSTCRKVKQRVQGVKKGVLAKSLKPIQSLAARVQQPGGSFKLDPVPESSETGKLSSTMGTTQDEKAENEGFSYALSDRSKEESDVDPEHGAYSNDRSLEPNVLRDCIVRKAIQDCYYQGIIPTVEGILQVCHDSGLTCTKDSVNLHLSSLGFSWTTHPRKLPVENPRLAAQRMEYMDELEEHRANNLVYLLVSDVVTRNENGWEVWPSDGVSLRPSSVVVLHALSNGVLVKGALKVLELSKRHKANVQEVAEWLRNYVLPSIPDKSVVILGHPVFETAEEAERPHMGCSKGDIIEWLESFSVSIDPNWSKMVLLNKTYGVTLPKKFVFDEMIRQKCFTPLHLPSHHRDLNPLEFIWRDILDKLVQTLAVQTTTDLITFVSQEFVSCTQIVTSVATLLVKKFESSYRDFDSHFDEVFDRMTIVEDLTPNGFQNLTEEHISPKRRPIKMKADGLDDEYEKAGTPAVKLGKFSHE